MIVYDFTDISKYYAEIEFICEIFLEKKNV